MRNGIIEENGELVYFKDDLPFHAGAIEIDGDIYYIGRHGRVAIGEHVVHSEMTNGVLERGTYTFGEDGKLIEGSFVPVKTVKRKHSKKSKVDVFTINKKKAKLTKKQKITVLGIVCAVVLLVAGAIVIDKLPIGSKGAAVTANTDIVLPDFSKPVRLSTVAAEKLYNNEYTVDDLRNHNPYLAFEFEYRIYDEDGMLYISENADMSNAMEYVLSKSDDYVTVDNLKTGTKYYCEIKVGDETFTRSFETAQGIRFINIPGVTNTRDIGGYATDDGGKIKQGMIIRGAELDRFNSDNYLTDDDAKVLHNQIRFALDMDLRYSYKGDYVSPLGSDVKHYFYNLPQYPALISIFDEEYKNSVKNVFTDLAKPENYPLYMHCTYGADRTGTIVYLLQGLLGVSDEDMLKEFQLTGIYNYDYASGNRMKGVADKINTFPGNTTAEKIEHWLVKEIGITKEQIASIRNILIEK